jgi:perosamine synthetase
MPTDKLQIPLAKTDIGQAERDAVARVMDSGRLALGPEIDAFEREFAHWHGVDAAAMTNSGTSALTCALRAVGVSPGDEVVMPALTFVGTANAILNCGAVPVLVDVEQDTGNLDPNEFEKAIGPRTKAVVPVHLFGVPADMGAVMPIARAHGLGVVEDAAEALGTRCGGGYAGTVGDAGIFGFYPNKVLTTAEGGMVISQDRALVERARAVANQGGGDAVSSPGMSFRANELCAALGRAQLQSLDRRIGERNELARAYREALCERTALDIFGYGDGKRSWFTCPVLLPKGLDRDGLRNALAKDGIASGNYFPAIHTLPGFADLVAARRPLPVAESLGSRLLALPFWPGLEEHLDHLCTRLAKRVADLN